MKFISPSLKKIYKILSENKELVEYLSKNNLLLTKEKYFGIKSADEIKRMDSFIYMENVKIFYSLANCIFEKQEEIEKNNIDYLCMNKIAFYEILGALGIYEANTFGEEVYKNVIYTYKYSFVSAFFQNNKDNFFTEIDLDEIRANESLDAFTDAMMKEFDKFDDAITECCEYRNFDEIPQSLINYLSQLVGFEKGNLDITEETEEKYREIIKSIIDIYRVKGTNYSFEIFFGFLGYNIKIEEFYFDRRMYFNNSGNPRTQETDSNRYGYYLVTENPADNEIDISINEFVRHNDFSKQLNLHEFDDLVSEHGIEAVLGYSKFDRNGEIYKGEVYKYFKTNVVYYIVNNKEENPSPKELRAINKLLTFLTPAYIARDTRVEVFIGKTKDSIDDNTIFFDRTTDSQGKTILENLEEQVPELIPGVNDGNVDQKRAELREWLRDTYPIMLDSEERDSDEGHQYYTKQKLASDGKKEELQKLSDYGTWSTYKNTGNNYDYKKKIPVKMTDVDDLPVIASANNYSLSLIEEPTDNRLSVIKKCIKESDSKRLIKFIINGDIKNFINDDESFNKLSLHNTYIKTLCLVEKREITTTKNEEGKDVTNEAEILYKLYNKYKFINNDKNLKEIKEGPINYILNPYSFLKEDDYKNLKDNMQICCKQKSEEKNYIIVYNFGNMFHSGSAYQKKYENSYKIKLIESKGLKSFDGSELDINMPDELKVKRNTLDELYEEIEEHEYFKSNYMKKYFYEKNTNKWYIPIAVPNLIIEPKKDGKEVAKNDMVIPEEEIQIVYKNKDGYSLTKEGPYFDTPKIALENENINIYNYFLFYVVDVNNNRNSDLFTFTYENKNDGVLIYSELDKKIYEINKSPEGYKEADIDGKLEKDVSDNYYIYSFDRNYQGYDETDEKESYIFYNNDHVITWENLGLYKSKDFLKRPIKEYTDNYLDDHPDLYNKLIDDIFYSSFFYINVKKRIEIVEAAYPGTKKTVYDLIYDFKMGVVTIEQINNIYNVLYEYGEKIGFGEKFKLLNGEDFYGKKYPIPYCLFRDFIEHCRDKKCRYFLKEYFYYEILERWRSDPIKEEMGRDDSLDTVGRLKRNSYLSFNGHSGSFGESSSIGSWYRNKKCYNIKVDEIINEEGYTKIIVNSDSTEEKHDSKSIQTLIKNKDAILIIDLIIVEKINNKYKYKIYKNKKVSEVIPTTVVFDKSEIGLMIKINDSDIRESLEENDKKIAYISINNIEQRFNDNIFDYPVHAYERKEYIEKVLYKNEKDFFYDKEFNKKVADKITEKIFLESNKYLCTISKPINTLFDGDDIKKDWNNNENYSFVTVERNAYDKNIENYDIPLTTTYKNVTIQNVKTSNIVVQPYQQS